jgi:hypothetical protein
MPTEIVASQGIPIGTTTISWLDWNVILGVPFWVFLICLFLFVIAAEIVWWWAKLRKLSAVAGWSESLKKQDVHDVQVWIITRTQKLIIGCMKIEDNILSYHDKTKIGMWHHNTRESVIRVGGNPAVVVSEDFDQTRDFISEIALTDNCDIFNTNQEELRKWKEEQKLDGNTVIEPIENYTDYEDYGRETLQMVHPNGLPLRIFNIFSNIRFLKYFPLGCSHMFFGADVTLESRLLKTRTKPVGFWEKHALLAGAIIVVVLLNICAWMIPLK